MLPMYSVNMFFFFTAFISFNYLVLLSFRHNVNIVATCLSSHIIQNVHIYKLRCFVQVKLSLQVICTLLKGAICKNQKIPSH